MWSSNCLILSSYCLILTSYCLILSSHCLILSSHWFVLSSVISSCFHPPNRALNFTYPPLALSPLLLSIHDWKQNSLRYPIPVPLLRHHTSAIITDCHRSTTLSPRLDLSGFWPGTETKRVVWLLRTGFGIAPVIKLVSLTWLLWALRSFRKFTLGYIKSFFFKCLIADLQCSIIVSSSIYEVETE